MKYAVIGEVFPASVVMNRHSSHARRRNMGVPRVCGDEPVKVGDQIFQGECSPRLWG